MSDGSTFADWIADPARHGRPPTLADLTYHATTLFPPVRPRGWLEIRYLDAQHPSLWPVCVAVTHALIMDDHAADTALTAIEAHGISPDPPSTTPHTATPPENATRTATGNGATSTDAAPTVIENGAARADTGPTVIENGGATRADATPTATGNGTAYTDAALSPAGTPTEIGTTTETGAATKTGAASAPAVPGRPISAPDGTGSPTTGPGSGGAPADIWQDAARCGLADPRLRRAAEVCFAAALDALPRLGAGPELIRMVADYADRYVRTGRSPAATLIELSTADGGLTPSGLLPHLLEAGGVNSPPPGSARPASEATAPAPPTGPAAPAAREVREVPAAQKGLDALGTHEAWTALASQEALSAPTASDTVSAPASREAQATQEALSAPAAREAAPRPAVRGAAAGRAARASQETSAQETSAQETSAEEASIQQTSAEEASAQEASTLQTSTQEASVQAASAQPAPAVPASRGRGRAGPRRPDPGAHALAAVSPSGPEGTP
ncbi:glutamate-cysteine ligase family protein [Thermocatellispora tengchongensis]|uniref:glutamate-cysteine ligase family protein n=1 Tax=Thermocatellispora tengchongensis TaxID=1073253 RepID=UPI0036367CE0